MKIKDFKYEKKNGEVNDYSLLVLNENDTHISGIEFTKLNDEEVEMVKRIQEEYEEKLSPYTKKAYRSFIKENFIIEEEN